MPVEYGLITTGFLLFTLLVALDALLGVVAGLAFLDDELDAADAAVALVEHVEVVVHAVGDRDAGTGERTGAVGQQRNVDAVLRLRRGDAARTRRPGRTGRAENEVFQLHRVSPFVRAGVAPTGRFSVPLASSGLSRPAASARGGNCARVCTISTGKATP